MKHKPDDAERVLDLLMGVLEDKGNLGERKYLDAISILSLPADLRKTAIAIHKKRRTTAEAIVGITGRGRDFERGCLEQLAEMGYLETDIEASVVYYSI